MELKMLAKEKDRVMLRINDVDISYVNSLRRYMAFEVPTMAIEEVEFRVNNSILYDEMVAHRLGLVPLKTDLDSYTLRSECSCKGAGCAQCMLTLTLKAAGPKTVYASELKSKDPKIKPVYLQMPIVKLLEGQDISFEATAVLGKGKEHAKWSPGLVSYHHIPDILIKKEPENAKEIVECCPKKIFEIKAGKLALNAEFERECEFCEECISVARPQGAIEIKKSNNFAFTVESWGQLEPGEILIKAIELFNDDLKEFAKLLETIGE
ncbi:MAG: DNA-directed RNA polymerase subunit D [Nanoarchaeota archaeon]